MNYLERMKKCMDIYDVADGWYVLSFGLNWYVGLIQSGTAQRTKKIGKVGAKRANYFDIACSEADKRNKKDGYSFREDEYCHIPRLKEKG